MAKGLLGGLGEVAIIFGAGAIATTGILFYFGLLKTGATAAYARSRYGENVGLSTNQDMDYTKYVPDYDHNMRVIVRGEFDENDYNNTLRGVYPPVAEADGWSPADPPISIRNEAIANFG